MRNRSYISQPEAMALLEAHQRVAGDGDVEVCKCGELYPCLTGRLIMTLERMDWSVEVAIRNLQAVSIGVDYKRDHNPRLRALCTCERCLLDFWIINELQKKRELYVNG